MALAGGEVRELVAEDLVEEAGAASVAVLGLSHEGGDADEATVGIAAAQGAGEAADVAARIDGVSSAEELDAYLERVLTAISLAEMGLG